MKFFKGVVNTHTMETPDVHIIQVKLNAPSDFSFIPGQYVHIKNPHYEKPDEEHIFSIASTPNNPYLEFCIREYGNWTKALKQLQIGDTLFISQAQGTFIFNNAIKDSVFLCGGVGISPLISILRDQHQKHSEVAITMIYGSRTEATIVYKNDLTMLERTMPNLRIVNVFSESEKKFQKSGYSGFITEDIIKKEVTFTNHPHWFITGPSVFIEKMQTILRALDISPENIHTEKV